MAYDNYGPRTEFAQRIYAMTDDPKSLELTIDGKMIRERFAVLEIATATTSSPTSTIAAPRSSSHNIRAAPSRCQSTPRCINPHSSDETGFLSTSGPVL